MTDDITASTSAADGTRRTVLETVVTAYYPRAIAAADSARNRAQAGYAIASAIATGLVVAGAFTSIEDHGWPAQLAGALALFAWILAGLLFLHAVATPVTQPLSIDELAIDADSPAWIEAVLGRAQSERTEVDRRNVLAILATIGAVFITIPAIALTGFSALSLNKDEVTLYLTRAGKNTVKQLCPEADSGIERSQIEGSLENRTLRRDFVVITVTPCLPEMATLHIRKTEISGISSR
jgi:MFS family permease